MLSIVLHSFLTREVRIQKLKSFLWNRLHLHLYISFQFLTVWGFFCKNFALWFPIIKSHMSWGYGSMLAANH
jgi:hypothetical protein